MSPYDSSHTDSAVFQDLPSSLHAMVTENIYKPHIAKVPLFRGCSVEFINQIVSRVHEEFVPPRKIITEQGSVVDHLYFICDGKLEEIVVYEGGPKESVSILTPHDSFGDVSILCNIPQPYTIRVFERSLLLRIDMQSFSNILNIYFHDKRKILNNLLEGKESDVHMKHMVSEIKAHIEIQEAHLALRLNNAAYNGDLTQLKSLIRAGADPNKKNFDGRSPLHLAASKGHEDITLFLIQEGVEVNISGILNSKDYDFRTPLHVATSRGSYGLAKLLVEAGANVLSKDSEILSANNTLIELLEQAKASQLSSQITSSSKEPSVTDRMTRRKCTIYPFQPWELPKDQNKYGVVLWTPDTIDELIEKAAVHFKLDLPSTSCIITEDAGQILDVDMIIDEQKLYLITT
ncbi:potassium channel SKOR-like protein [Tanacetum coccineum]|uniref:Potassium channel n=1 Tax=Tanacetum coccineum TaxID=301880 RepID=A0ABQ5FRD4_9ASTR